MPKRDDIKSVMVIGSGPIVIGQACEFDYSGTQACRVLREEGIRVILVNSNHREAFFMTPCQTSLHLGAVSVVLINRSFKVVEQGQRFAVGEGEDLRHVHPS